MRRFQSGTTAKPAVCAKPCKPAAVKIFVGTDVAAVTYDAGGSAGDCGAGESVAAMTDIRWHIPAVNDVADRARESGSVALKSVDSMARDAETATHGKRLLASELAEINITEGSAHRAIYRSDLAVVHCTQPHVP